MTPCEVRGVRWEVAFREESIRGRSSSPLLKARRRTGWKVRWSRNSEGSWCADQGHRICEPANLLIPCQAAIEGLGEVGDDVVDVLEAD